MTNFRAVETKGHGRELHTGRPRPWRMLFPLPDAWEAPSSPLDLGSESGHGLALPAEPTCSL